jgi:hypothetical protein
VEAAQAKRDTPLQERYIKMAHTVAQAYVNRPSGTLHDVCIDAGSSISLIDHAYFKKHFTTNRHEVSSVIHLDGVVSNTTHGWTELTLHLLGLSKEIITIEAASYVVTLKGHASHSG